MGTPCVIATVSALNLGIDFKSVPSMPPPDSFNRGLAYTTLLPGPVIRLFRRLLPFLSFFDNGEICFL